MNCEPDTKPFCISRRPRGKPNCDSFVKCYPPEGYRVQWLRSFWSEDRRRMICEYEAADAASVRDVQREAGATFDRVWPAELLGGALSVD